jgi:hypothetical protein
MAATIRTYTGAGSAEHFDVEVVSGGSGRDLRTCTAAELRVHISTNQTFVRVGVPYGDRLIVAQPETAVWPLSILSATESTITVRHVWDAAETTYPATINAMVALTFSDGVVQVGPQAIQIRGW